MMEENRFSLFPLLITTLLFISTTVLILKKSKLYCSKVNSPQGPWRLPLVGNLHQLVGSLPHRRLRDLANRYGPVMQLQIGEISTLVVSSPEAAEVVMKTHDLVFSQRPFLLAANVLAYGSADIAFSPCGEYWRQMRKVCTLELLSAKKTQSFRFIREKEISNLVKLISCSAGKSINLSRMFVSLTNCVLARAAFGKTLNQEDAFFPLIIEIVQVLGGFSITDVFPSIKFLPIISGMRSKLKKLHQEMDALLEIIIDEHRSKREKVKAGSLDDEPADLVDVLFDLQNHGNLEYTLTMNNIKAVVLDMFLAGSEASSTIMEWAMSEMLKNPRVMQKAQAEVRQFLCDEKENVEEADISALKYFNMVMKETLRMHPPAPLLLPRECQDRVEINGYQIPSKTQVIVNAWAIGRDPNYWFQADRFYPERFQDSCVDYEGTHFQFIPFGAGRRICPGAKFGMAIVGLSLANLLYHFDWELPDQMKSEDLDMTETFGAAVRRKNELYLVPTPYQRPVLVK